MNKEDVNIQDADLQRWAELHISINKSFPPGMIIMVSLLYMIALSKVENCVVHTDPVMPPKPKERIKAKISVFSNKFLQLLSKIL